MSEWSRVMSVNVDGTFNFCHHYIKEVMRYDVSEIEVPIGGYSIVNIGSNAILRSLAESAAYVRLWPLRLLLC